MSQVKVVIPEPPGMVKLIIPDEPRIVKIIVSLLSPGGFIIPTDVARLSLPNVFQRENTFPSIRTTPRLVTTNYSITHLDGEVVADASFNDITLTLPLSNGAGQNLRITRRDSSDFSVGIVTQGSDVIQDGLPLIPLDSFQTATLNGAAPNYWELGLFIPPFTLPSNIALLNANNVFTGVNSFGGLRLGRRTVSSSTTVQSTDFAIYAQGLTSDIDIQLPPAIVADGRGQYLRIKKLDDNAYVVRINPELGDLIDGAVSVNLVDQYAEAQLFEADVGYWDNTGSAISEGGGGGTIEETTNLLKGDNLGGAIDSGIDPATVVQVISPLPATPTTLNETIALLQSYGLCS